METGALLTRVRQVKFREHDNPDKVAADFCSIFGLKKDKEYSIARIITEYLQKNVPDYTARMSEYGFSSDNPYSFDEER